MKRQICQTFMAFMCIFSVAAAVQTNFAEHNSESQFAAGKTDGVIATSDGNIVLARPAEAVLADCNDVWVVNDIVQLPDGTIAAATSGKGQIYRISNGSADIVYDGEEDGINHVFSIAVDQHGRLIAGTGGSRAVLLHEQADGSFAKLPLTGSDPNAETAYNYVWDIVPAGSGLIYLATGPQGKILAYDLAARSAELVYDAQESNILCLAMDRDGFVYAGGDELGIVYRIDPASKTARVVYDCDHSEISSLVFDSDMNLYASTADAGAARPGAELKLDSGNQGRPENEPKPADEEMAVDEPNVVIEQDPARQPQADQMQQAAMPAGNGPPSSGAQQYGSTRSGGETTGNQIYQISSAGFVRSVFSQPVIILALAVDSDDNLIVATGSDGKLLYLDVDSERAGVMFDSEVSAQIASVITASDGTIYAGGANPGMVTAIKPGLLNEGTYTSTVIDAGQISSWGQIQVDAEIPPQSSLFIQTRTGNTEDPELHAWNDWSARHAVADTIAADAAPGRFLQYRLTLESADQQVGPSVGRVKVAYLMPNLPPRVVSVAVSQAGNGSNGDSAMQHNPNKTVQWQANDENDDSLTYDLAIRQIGRTRWIVIAEDITETQHTWNTLTVADGRYEIKVTASDLPSNAAGQALSSQRISNYVIVDNSPPRVDQLDWHISDDNTVSVRTSVSDELSVIKSVAYCLDSNDFQPAQAEDGIFDSMTEAASFNVSDLETGEHVLAVRYMDVANNATYRNVIIEIND